MNGNTRWLGKDPFFEKGVQVLAEKSGATNLNCVNLDEFSLHEFMATYPILPQKSNVIVCSPALYPFSLFLLSECPSVHAVFTSDIGINIMAEAVMRMPFNGKIAFTRSKGIPLTLSEFRILHLWIQGISMTDIASILGTSLSTVYSYRKKLSEKMQFPHKATPSYTL